MNLDLSLTFFLIGYFFLVPFIWIISHALILRALEWASQFKSDTPLILIALTTEIGIFSIMLGGAIAFFPDT